MTGLSAFDVDANLKSSRTMMDTTMKGKGRGSKSLTCVPDDVLLEIFSFLDPYTVVSLFQVCKRFYGFRDSYTVWHNAHVNLLHRARFIDLQALDQPSVTSATGAALRRSVLRSATTERNWLSSSPTFRTKPKVIQFLDHSQVTAVSLDQAGYITKFTSRHMLVPLADGMLMAWDMQSGRQAGMHTMDPESVLIDLAHVNGTRSLMGLTGKVSVIRVEDTFGMHIRLAPLRIDVPAPEDEEQLLNFEPMKKITLLLPFSSEVHILDASRRMLCAGFSIQESLHMGILIIFDWETEEAAMFDTGIPYQYGRALVGMQLLPDGKTLMLDSELNGHSIRWYYDLTSPSLTRTFKDWNAVDFQPESILEPIKTSTHQWQIEPRVLSDAYTTNPYLFWELNQLPAPPFGIPTRVSTVIMYVTVPARVVDPRPEEKLWRIAQHYTDSNGPCAHSRTIATLHKPVLGPIDTDEHGMPLVCLSFNQFGWVTTEEVSDGFGGMRNKRVLKLMTFPDPGETFDGDLSSQARSLDVPSEVLDMAYHILLDSTQGLVIIATLENTLFVYHYSG